MTIGAVSPASIAMNTIMPRYPVTRPAMAKPPPVSLPWDRLIFTKAMCPQMTAGIDVIPQKNEEIPSTMLVIANPEFSGMAVGGKAGEPDRFAKGIQPDAP